MHTSTLSAAFAAAALLLTGCTRDAPSTAPAPPAVTVMLPLAREIVDWDEYTGRLEAVETVELRARVSGYLDKVHFKEGSEVKKGDLLFTIDPRPYQAIHDMAEAEQQRAASQTALAKNDFERARGLIAGNVISEEDFDTKAKTYAAAEAAAKSAEATRRAARLNLEFTEVRAPIAGRVGRALVTEGNLVSGGGAGAATLLTTLVTLDPVYCYVDVDERSILKYSRLAQSGSYTSARTGRLPVEMALADEEGYPHKGLTDFVDNRVDPSTGTMRARGVFANTDNRLSPGFFARLRVPGSAKYSALLVPDRAIGSDQAQKFVFVVNAQKAVEYRPVKIGALNGGLRVIVDGLAPGEPVIVEGLMRVRPGVVVDPQPTESL